MDIRIGKSAHQCQGCERPFNHEEDHFSLVRLHEQALLREDYCKSCWDPDRATDAYSVWSPRYYDPRVAEQEPPEVFSPLRQTFYQAVETNDRNEMAMAYLAAQLLRRQKVFRLIKETDDPDGEVNLALYSDRIGNRLIEVRDPRLSYAEMEEGRLMLMMRLSELEDPPEEAAVPQEAVPGEAVPVTQEAMPVEAVPVTQEATEGASHAQSQEQPQEDK